MPISDVPGYQTGHFGRVYEHLLKPAIIAAGYDPVRADDTNKTDYIVVGIIQRIVESSMVLCDYSTKNPNVMYELGIRHAFNKPVVLLKDHQTDKVFDIQGLRYVDYDETLRIDSVQKDIIRITSAIKETAAADSKDLNSVVQLAGITAAQVPEAQEVSRDTELLMAAIASLERRVDEIAVGTRADDRLFRIESGTVLFSGFDGDRARTGQEIYRNGERVGTLVEIRPSEDKIFIRDKNGVISSFYAYSDKSSDLTTLPF